jgi:hypothetical protein
LTRSLWFNVRRKGCTMMRLGFLGLILAVSCGGPEKPPEDATNTSDTSETPTAKPTAPSIPTGTPPATQPKSTTPYDKEAVEIALNRAARQVKSNCGGTKDDSNKLTGPWGKTTVTVQLGHNGHSKGATIKPPFDGTPVGRCINNAFSNLIYPPFDADPSTPGGDDSTVDWDVEVVHPDMQDKGPTK